MSSLMNRRKRAPHGARGNEFPSVFDWEGAITLLRAGLLKSHRAFQLPTTEFFQFPQDRRNDQVGPPRNGDIQFELQPVTSRFAECSVAAVVGNSREFPQLSPRFFVGNFTEQQLAPFNEFEQWQLFFGCFRTQFLDCRGAGCLMSGSCFFLHFAELILNFSLILFLYRAAHDFLHIACEIVIGGHRADGHERLV